MKINNVSGVLGTYNQHKTRKVSKSGEVSRPGKNDEILLSREAQEVRTLKDKVAQVSDIRAERVAELRQQISAGTYRVSGRDVAEKMLKTKVFDGLA